MRIFYSISLFFIGLINFAQTDETIQEERKNELTVNVFYPIAFKSIEVNYERIINEDNSYGLSAQYANYTNLKNHYMLSPYFRKYFSKGNAKGFYLETFLSLNGGKYNEDNSYGYYDENSDQWVYVESYDKHPFTDVAFGIGAGVKFLTSDHFVGTLHAGIARNLFSDDYYSELIGRGGISIGYRF